MVGSVRCAPEGALDLVPEHFRAVYELEPHAHVIRGWYCERVTGLLQSEAYMINQFQSASRTQEDLTKLMINRFRRLRILEQEHGPHVQIIVGEGTLKRMPGGPDPQILKDQLEHMIGLIQRYRKLSVYLLPFVAKLPYVPNDFTMMDFTNNTKSFVYIEYPGGGQQIEKPEIYSACYEQWDNIRGAALERDATRERLVELVAECQEELAQPERGNDPARRER